MKQTRHYFWIINNLLTSPEISAISSIWVILSRSSRALVEASIRAEITPISIDEYADIDTQKMAIECHLLPKSNNLPDAITSIRNLLCDISSRHDIDGLIIGSGFESIPEILAALNEDYIVLSNSVECIKNANTPEVFFKLLDELEIRHPVVTASVEEISSGTSYLIKRVGADGGSHIRWYNNAMEKPGAEEYLQEFCPGTSLSATFIANSKICKLLGINRLFHTSVGSSSFCYAGAVQIKDTATDLHREIHRISEDLVKRLGLKGVCGIDFVITDSGEIILLELNPRPTATMELYDESTSPILNRHIESFFSENLSEVNIQSHWIRGYRVVYAHQQMIIPERVDWPEWIKDRPAPGKEILPNIPFCSIHAKATNTDGCENLLNKRVQWLNKFIYDKKFVL